MPHGVQPCAQPANVPSAVRPDGSRAVCMRSAPAAGPLIAHGVSAVTLRAYFDGRTTRHPPSFCSTSMTETPDAAIAFATFAADQFALPSGNRSPSL